MAEDLSQNKPDDKPESLKRVRKETEAQKQAFDLYYGMGEKRSLEAVAAGCGRSTRTIG